MTKTEFNSEKKKETENEKHNVSYHKDKNKRKISYFPCSIAKMPMFSGPYESWTRVSFFPNLLAYPSKSTQQLPFRESKGNKEVKGSCKEWLLLTRKWRGWGGGGGVVTAVLLEGTQIKPNDLCVLSN